MAAGVSPAAAAPAIATPDEQLAPTPRRAWTARLVTTATIRSKPEADAKPIGRIAPIAVWNGGVVRLLVLGRHAGVDGRRWLRVALPTRPNGSDGWIDADVARLSATPWRIEIDLRARRGSAFRDGRRVRTWPVVIGTAATPTPRGLFAVYERVRQPLGSELGPWALHITGHSDVLDDFGGGPGRVALHGRAGALLNDPLGSAASHGCIRQDDGVIAWLAARAGPGTPVLVR
ncbi:L,D-transpeptidase [Conexibacter stalactiti]|uniref:L,D-transpeptidase n=1 Tax=Conexibacter stalactiti TaxID=1940611 RepID=A0ABU4HWX9_9ACTN|nr:L,D-transpeptidase [Conexibacter stalactiti]MDW5597735.1 L,D-transpeptidase [Conexibacter stalactiti]MEC5038377.1 L,D-transpeptidase [Conexibacter stalactiti]